MDSSGENKRARIERGQFLFLEMSGELFGIDLSGAGAGSDSQILPLSGVTRCRLDIYKHGYPLGMCLVKMGDKQYLIGGLKRNQVEYADDVYELNTDPCRISSSIIREPKHVLEPTGTRIKDPKIALAFNLKGKFYLLHSRLFGCGPIDIPVPFERLDVAAGADAAAPPFSCHEVPVPYDDPSVASSHFILDDKLVLFFECYRQIYVFTPPDGEDDDDSGNGKWCCHGYEFYNDSVDSFLPLGYTVPPAGIFLSSDFFHVPDPDDATDSLRVLLAFHGILELDNCDEANSRISEEVRAYAISTKTFKAKYYQKLDGVLSDLIPDHACFRICFLEDTGKGDQECTRRICSIMISNGYLEDDILTSYLSVSVFDVQLIQPPPPDMQLIQPPPGRRQFLKVLPIKKLVFEIDHDKKYRHSPIANAFIV